MLTGLPLVSGFNSCPGRQAGQAGLGQNSAMGLTGEAGNGDSWRSQQNAINNPTP